MPLSVSAAIFAFLLTTATAIVLMKRSSNWRIRFLAFTAGMAPLCQSIILLADHNIWVTPDARRTAEILELVLGALSLAAIYLLNKENQNRKNTDSRLRMAEAAPLAAQTKPE